MRKVNSFILLSIMLTPLSPVLVPSSFHLLTCSQRTDTILCSA